MSKNKKTNEDFSQIVDISNLKLSAPSKAAMSVKLELIIGDLTPKELGQKLGYLSQILTCDPDRAFNVDEDGRVFVRFQGTDFADAGAHIEIKKRGFWGGYNITGAYYKDYKKNITDLYLCDDIINCMEQEISFSDFYEIEKKKGIAETMEERKKQREAKQNGKE